MFEWDPSIARRVGDLAAPALVALSLDPLLSIVDSVIVGQQSTTELAAIGLNTFILSFALFICGSLLSTALGPLVAEKRAAGSGQDADDLIEISLGVAVLLGVALAVLLNVGADTLLRDVMGASDDLLPIAAQFLRFRALAAPAVFVCSVGSGAFRGNLDTKTPLHIALLANTLNLVLDGVFVLGFGWGASGAACATGVAEWVSAACFVWALKKKENAEEAAAATTAAGASEPSRTREGKNEKFLAVANANSRRYYWEKLQSSLKGPQFKELVSASSPIFLRTFLLQLALTAAAAAAARSIPSLALDSTTSHPLLPPPGELAAVSAHQILSSLWLFTSFALDSFAVAAQALVADARGRNDPVMARKVSGHALVLGLRTGCLFSFALRVVPAEVTVGLFSSDPAVVAAAAPVLHTWVSAVLPVNGVVFVADGVMQGYRAFKFEAQAMLVSTAVAATFFLVVCPSLHSTSPVFHQEVGAPRAALPDVLSAGSLPVSTSLWPDLLGSAVVHETYRDSGNSFFLADVWCALAVLQVARATSFAVWAFSPWGLREREK